MTIRILLTLALLAAAAPARAVPRQPDPRAEALYRSAQQRLLHSTVESRRLAIEDLEQATLIDREFAAGQLLLARLYLECGFVRSAQRRFELVTAMSPDDPDGRLGLGQVWRRDWLKYLERRSLDRAIQNFSAAARMRPDAADSWIYLAPLLLARGDLAPAMAAANRAMEAEPQRVESQLLLAHLSYRTGRVGDADSLFRAVIPRLSRLARARFDDIAPVATARDTFVLHRLSPADQRAFIEQFWRANDPDPTSVENEARLEYWSRVAQAYFLYFNQKRREWDERGELYVRYGPPQFTVYNPIGSKLTMSYPTGPAYPLNLLLWAYTELGMQVNLQDRLLSEYYLLPISMDFDPDPLPNPNILARLDSVAALSGGRGVFPKLPPGVETLPMNGRIARFTTERGPRLLADLEAPGTPADTLEAEWVVLDSTHHEVARETRRLAPSACDPTERRVADFAHDLPPGRYTVGMSVRDGGARRGVYREEVELTGDEPGLAMSDVVVSCGTPDVTSGPGVRIEPNAGGLVAPGGAVTAYFEIYHLATGDDGQSKFEYECSVRAERDPRVWVQRVFQPRTKLPDIDTRREGENVGTLRRQFVSLPVKSLPPGRYHLDITVRDQIARSETKGSAMFQKLDGPAPN